VEAPTLASAVQSLEAASHMWASGRPLVGLVAKNYIQVIVEQIRYTSCILQNKIQNVTSTYRKKSLLLGLEGEPAGSGWAPVASGMGAKAPATAGCVGAAPVLLGRRWSYRATGAEARASGRGGRSSGVAWAAVSGDGGG
jgi:hypothetical protein